MDVTKFIGNVATVPANEIEIARLPKRTLFAAPLLDGMPGLEFPLMHEHRNRLRPTDKEKMCVIRHDDVTQNKEVVGCPQGVEDCQENVAFFRREGSGAFCQVCGDKENTIAICDSP